ncbi:hypothetical protein CVT26_000446 [Gymnopilus dilepis]|uniref:Uncharacterized protein n=1 Tax=Gymnopilus dilepis TaxID=231916 RepID=A0A409WL09_9AGAR|nr:hypothetical protein CVT26_000446 [Gymnopilus dilepis]
MDTSLLTLELDFEFGHEISDPYDLENETKREKTWSSYQNISQEFALPGGLKDVFVHLASPYDETEDGESDESLVRKERASCLERQIMGYQYDSEARGKYTNRGTSVYDEVFSRFYASLQSQ